MKFRPRFLLILAAAAAAFLMLAAVACGGEEEEGTPPATPTAAAGTPAAGESPAAEESPTPGRTPTGAAGELPDIAAYPGAQQTFSGTFTGEGAAPVFLPGDSPLEPEQFGKASYSVFQTDDPMDKVFDFYKSQFKDWKEEWTWSAEVEGTKARWGVWSKDGGSVAAWVGAAEEDGTTSVTVVRASQG